MPDLPTTPPLRSYLFAPGSSDRILAKVVEAGADAVVLDLEDAVAPSQKAEARTKVAALIEARGADAPCELHVRTNLGRDGAYDREDLRAVVVPGLRAIRLPKVEDPDAVREVDALLAELEVVAGIEVGTIALYTSVESAVGLHAIAAVAAASPRVTRTTFGSADYIADLGARSIENELGAYSRARMLVDSRAAGLGAPVDGVHTDIDDLAGLEAAAERARDLGFSGKSVIHPKHLPIVNRVFSPSDEEVAWAREVIEAYEAAEAGGTAAIVVDGGFVDSAIVARARGVLALLPEEN